MNIVTIMFRAIYSILFLYHETCLLIVESNIVHLRWDDRINHINEWTCNIRPIYQFPSNVYLHQSLFSQYVPENPCLHVHFRSIALRFSSTFLPKAASCIRFTNSDDGRTCARTSSIDINWHSPPFWQVDNDPQLLSTAAGLLSWTRTK